MSNMSYCMFENTYRDLRQVADALAHPPEPDESLSEYELKARYDLIQLCHQIAEQCDPDDFHPDFNMDEV